jgi:fructose-bisphosphate aldolase class 1
MTATLLETAQARVGAGRGLLAVDESNPTCDKSSKASTFNSGRRR